MVRGRLTSKSAQSTLKSKGLRLKEDMDDKSKGIAKTRFLLSTRCARLRMENYYILV